LVSVSSRSRVRNSRVIAFGLVVKTRNIELMSIAL
jgi:hypothetical protein